MGLYKCTECDWTGRSLSHHYATSTKCPAAQRYREHKAAPDVPPTVATIIEDDDGEDDFLAETSQPRPQEAPRPQASPTEGSLDIHALVRDITVAVMGAVEDRLGKERQANQEAMGQAVIAASQQAARSTIEELTRKAQEQQPDTDPQASQAPQGNGNEDFATTMFKTLALNYLKSKASEGTSEIDKIVAALGGFDRLMDVTDRFRYGPFSQGWSSAISSVRELTRMGAGDIKDVADHLYQKGAPHPSRQTEEPPK